MAHLTENEKKELLRASVEIAPHGVGVKKLKLNKESRMQYVEFATFASQFCQLKKPVDFSGSNWLL